MFFKVDAHAAEGGTSRGMKKFLYGFCHSEYRDKAGATPGANIRK